MEGDLHVHTNGSVRRGAYPGTQRVEEVRDLLRKNDSDLDSAVELQCHGSEIRPIADLLGHIEYSRFGFQTDARTIMQNSIDCADRNTERSGDFFDSTSFGRLVHRVRVKTRSTRVMVRPFRARRTVFLGRAQLCSSGANIEVRTLRLQERQWFMQQGLHSRSRAQLNRVWTMKSDKLKLYRLT